MKDHVIIFDWAGNILFKGHYQSPEVERILKLNKAPNDDIDLDWLDPNDDRNPWEHVVF